MSSIAALPGVIDVTALPDGTLRVECGPELDVSGPELDISLIGGRVLDGSTKDQDGYYDMIVGGVALPEIIDEDATNEADRHNCDGSYSDTLPDCEQAEHANDVDETDTEGHVWRHPYSVVGGCRQNPGVRSGGGTAISEHSVCRLCGMHRHEYMTGSQRNPGECDTITLRDRDKKSEAWLKETHEEDGLIPAWLAEMLGR